MPSLAGFASPHARAILWAQFRSLRNRMPRANKLGLAFTAVIGIVWYGLFALAAIAAGFTMADATQMDSIERILPGGLLLVFMYWLLVPVLLASKGASLELRKLMVYPIPNAEFFRLEMVLRLSVGIEPLMLVTGAVVGLYFNSAVPFWSPPALVVFVLFAMFFAAGVHDLLGRLMARKGIREMAALVFIMAVALPQLIVTRGQLGQVRWIGVAASWVGWPWSAAAQIAEGHARGASIPILLAWTAAAYFFGRQQFERTLRFDESEHGARQGKAKAASRVEWFFNWPNLLFRDPIAALVEKEIRFLSRASRFRTVFVMGFSFGLIIWWPLAFGRNSHSWMAGNFITVVSLYAVLLLSDVLFWNAFGFDRTAAQLYFVIPVRTKTVLAAKNIASVFFVLLETTIALVICAIVRLPVTPSAVLEAYIVTLLATLLLLSIGNMTSFYSPRAVDPSKSLRSSRSGRVQAMMLAIYPVVAIPLALAYGARYAFDSQAAFYGVLSVVALVGAIAYRIAIDSAVDMAEKRKEAILAALSRGDGPVE